MRAVAPALERQQGQQEGPEAKLHQPPGDEMRGVVHDQRSPGGEDQEAQRRAQAEAPAPHAEADGEAGRDSRDADPGGRHASGTTSAEQACPGVAERGAVRQGMAREEFAERHIPDRLRCEEPVREEFRRMRGGGQQDDSRGKPGGETERMQQRHRFGIMRRDQRELQAAQPHGGEHDQHRNADGQYVEHRHDQTAFCHVVPAAPKMRSIAQAHRLARPTPRRLLAVIGSLAGLALLGGAALTTAAPTSRADDMVAVAVVEHDGSCTLRALEPARLARIEAALAEEAEALKGMATRLIEDAAAARLAEAREQVPAFGAWAYDWVQSYITSYRILGRLLRGVASSVQGTGEGTSLAERVTEEMAQPIREEFRRRVLSADLPAALAADLAHVATVLDGAWHAALQQAGAELSAAPAMAGTAAAARLDLAAAAQPFGPALAALAPQDALAVVAGEPADTAAIFARSMRPMAARVGAAVVRASEAGSIVTAAGAFGYALGGTPGVALGAVGGIGLSWAIDWGLNRVDAALNRAEFEAQALAAIGAAERRIVQRAAEAASVALTERHAALRPTTAGCAAAGARR